MKNGFCNHRFQVHFGFDRLTNRYWQVLPAIIDLLMTKKRLIMDNAPIRTVFGVISDFLTSDPSPHEILAYHLPPDLQARADELVERNGEGELTFDELLELYDFMRADDMMMMIKAKTRRKLRDADQ
jgi:hypothetical protein